MRPLRNTTLICAAILTWPLQAAAQATTGVSQAASDVHWDVATGIDYSTGRYGGASDTTILSVPLAVRVQMDAFRLELTMPYLQVRGPDSFSSGAVIGGNSPVTTRSGLGDLTVGGAWTLTRDKPSMPGIELEGTIKVPTASPQLGTGKFDYSLQTNINHSITPDVMLFGSVGYQWLSDFDGFHLKNGVMAQAGANYKSSADTNIGFSVNYRQPYYQTLDEQLSLSPYVLWTFGRHWRISAYGIVGFTNASPDAGGGMRLIFFN